ncbi:PBP1A family penicillin-binding protein [Bacillus lacus]|uniref:PBP1A family penicillin-binding protein n=1 Tax=Metabacillus lacus TaxID=1983721 RepID=A0A7X2LWG6_9BACI|nr:PBP1A family penicillin-binding protein [Metabacillus lacus]MRX71450.1 PBP1A family penicillin-binding protein [Metabacillus lacus]
MRKSLFRLVTLMLVTFVIALAGYLMILLMGNYVIDEKKLVFESASVLADSNGEELTKLFTKNRKLIGIEEIPQHVQEAFVAVEDKRFYEHHGIDFRAIGRALYKDILAGSKVEGGSTITQQLAKNIFLSHEKSMLRKTKEAVIAINLEREYSKQKLLEMYLNQVYFGHGAYGIEAAAKFYFNKQASQLTLEEGALLAGLPKAPNSYSPVNHLEKSKGRRDLVLSLMQQEGYITSEEAVRTQGKTVQLSLSEKTEKPWLDSYIDLVMDEAERKYGISNEELLRGGYKIYVPMNQDIQQQAFEKFADASYFPGTDNGAQGSFVLLDNKTGGVLSAIGGRNYTPKGFNRVKSKRQPGSAFKPLAVYGPAIDSGEFHPYSLLDDNEQTFGDYAPKNHTGEYGGEVTMYDALIASKNIPAVWTLNEIGVKEGKTYLAQMGMPIKDNGLAIALGGLNEGVSPLQLAGAYRTFPRNGVYSEPFFIEKLEDQHGKEIEAPEEEEKRIFSQQTAWYMTKMLEKVVDEGTARTGSYQGTLAGKTGTTSYPGKKGAVMDAWFAGYTPEVTGVIWMGYDQTDEQHYLTQGSAAPTKLFKEIAAQSPIKKDLAFIKPGKANELEDPIRLAELEDIEIGYTFKTFGLVTVRINWTPQNDERVEYRVYEKPKNGEERMVGSVTGEGSFDVPYANIFSDTSYKVVPYNTQTKKEGAGSAFVEPTLFTSRK